MKKSIRKWSYLAALLLVSCQQNVVSDFTHSDSLELSLQASITGKVMSKTSTDTDGRTVFVEGDKIGLFMEGEDTPSLWTSEGGNWKPETPLYWPDQENNYDFCAFYPYVEGAVRSHVIMPDLSRQEGRLETVGKWDFLAAFKNCNYESAEGKVSFTGESSFKHVYSLVMVTLVKNENDAETSLNTICFEGKDILTPHYYDFIANKMIKETEAPESSLLELVTEEGSTIPEEGYSVAVLLNPVAMESPLKFSITYERDAFLYEASTESMASTLEGGHCYKYKVRIEKEGLILEGSEVSDWQTDGGVGDIIVNDVPAEE